MVRYCRWRFSPTTQDNVTSEQRNSNRHSIVVAYDYINLANREGVVVHHNNDRPHTTHLNKDLLRSSAGKNA